MKIHSHVISQRISYGFFLVVLALGVSACASLVPPHPFDIQNIASGNGELSQANIHADDFGVFLYGHLVYGDPSGHADISTTTPDSSTTCISQSFSRVSSGPSRSGSRLHTPHHEHKFEFQLDALPEAGSLLRVWYHQGELHQSCTTDRQ